MQNQYIVTTLVDDIAEKRDKVASDNYNRSASKSLAISIHVFVYIGAEKYSMESSILPTTD